MPSRLTMAPPADSAKQPVMAVIVSWCMTSTTGCPSAGNCVRNARNTAMFVSQSGRRSKNELCAGNSVTGPISGNLVVSRHRHHSLEHTRVSCRPACVSRRPSAAWKRPAASRLRRVEQSSSVKCGGSPIPGASAWRRISTRPGFANSASGNGPPASAVVVTAIAALMSNDRRRMGVLWMILEKRKPGIAYTSPEAARKSQPIVRCPVVQRGHSGAVGGSPRLALYARHGDRNR